MFLGLKTKEFYRLFANKLFKKEGFERHFEWI